MQPATSVPRMAVAMRYRDVAAASAWLVAAFGFTEKATIRGPAGRVSSAQLALGSGMVLLETVGETGFDSFMRQPDEIGGAETQSCYFVVPDADAHCRTARAAGAILLSDIEEFDNGGRGYSCRDPEGHVWTFGTYDPWLGDAPLSQSPPSRSRAKPMATGFGLIACIVASAMTGAWFGDILRQPDSTVAARVAVHQSAANVSPLHPAADERARESAERTVRDLRDEIARERTARNAAEQDLQDLQKTIADQQSSRDAAERTAREMHEELALVRTARDAAQQELHTLQGTVAGLVSAREAAERAIAQIDEDLAQERRARAAAERRSEELQQQVSAPSEAVAAAERAVREAVVRTEQERSAKDIAIVLAQDVQMRLAAEQAARERLEREVGQARAELGRGAGARSAAEHQVEAARAQLEEERAAREAAEQAVQEARAQLEAEQNHKRVAWRMVADLRKEVARLRAEAGEEPPAPAPKAKQMRRSNPAAKNAPQ